MNEEKRAKKREDMRKWRAEHPGYYKQWRTKNIEKERDRVRRFKKKHAEEEKARKKRYRQENKEKIRAYDEKYRAENIETLRMKDREYRLTHPDRIRDRRKASLGQVLKHAKKRRATDPNYKIKVNLRTRIGHLLRGIATKSARTIELLGCTIPELRAHLESQFREGMSFENYGRTGWHIDHIIPCAMFDLRDPAQQRACFHWSNLQPLWARDNCRKGARVGKFGNSL